MNIPNEHDDNSGYEKRLDDGPTQNQESNIEDEFAAPDELKAAKDYFSTAATSIGSIREYTRPFTKQLKKDTELMFPVDWEFYVEASNVQKKVLSLYFALRCITFSLFAVMVCVQLYVFGHAFIFDHTKNEASHIHFELLNNELISIAFIILIGISFGGIRLAFRKLFFYVLKTRARHLSYKIFKRIDDINTRVTETCSKSRDRVGGGLWRVRAKNWMLIAQWNSRRAEHLDRFITTVIWAIRTYITNLERSFLLLKLIFVTLATWGIFSLLPSSDFSLSLLGIFWLCLIIQAWIVWHVFDQQPPFFWTSEFRKSANTDPNAENYADKISGVVENLVDEVLGKEFGQSE